jgi:hypothetical protein
MQLVGGGSTLYILIDVISTRPLYERRKSMKRNISGEIQNRKDSEKIEGTLASPSEMNRP